MRNFDTSGNKNIGHNHLALEIIRGRTRTISFPDSHNDSVTQVSLAFFAVKLLKWLRWWAKWNNGLSKCCVEKTWSTVKGCTLQQSFLTTLPDQLLVLEHTTLVYRGPQQFLVVDGHSCVQQLVQPLRGPIIIYRWWYLQNTLSISNSSKGCGDLMILFFFF